MRLPLRVVVPLVLVVFVLARVAMDRVWGERVVRAEIRAMLLRDAHDITGQVRDYLVHLANAGGDATSLAAAIGMLRADVSMRAVVLADGDDVVVATLNPDPATTVAEVSGSDWSAARAALAAGETRSWLAGNAVAALAPATLPGRKPGWLLLVRSMANDDRALNAVMRQVFMVHTGASVVVMGLLAWLLGALILRRVHGLQTVAERLGRGESEARSELAGNDELSQVGRAFDAMADRLRVLNETLEQRVAERTGQLASAREQIERSERLASLGAMVAGIAHELNTPVGNAMLVANTLREQVGEFALLLDSQQIRRADLARHVDQVTSAAELLERNLESAKDLIGSFKQVAADQTSEQWRAYDLRETTREVLRTLQHAFRHTPFGLTLEPGEAIPMEGYPGPLAQVVTNLVNNALVHAFGGREQGAVTVTVRAISPERAELVVADDGVGIAPDLLPRIFDPFVTTRLGRGGSGLGLSLVHNIVTSVLGGTVEAQSEHGVGSRFVVGLPRTAPKREGKEKLA